MAEVLHVGQHKQATVPVVILPGDTLQSDLEELRVVLGTCMVLSSAQVSLEGRVCMCVYGCMCVYALKRKCCDQVTMILSCGERRALHAYNFSGVRRDQAKARGVLSSYTEYLTHS